MWNHTLTNLRPLKKPIECIIKTYNTLHIKDITNTWSYYFCQSLLSSLFFTQQCRSPSY